MTMVISVPPRRERKKQETRQRIVSEAIRIFADQGIDPTTVDEVATAADVGKGTIYNYFETKEDIVVAFLVDLEHKVQAEVASLIRRRGTLETILGNFILFQFKLKEPHHAFVKVFLSQMLTRATPESSWIQELQSAVDPPVEKLFASLQQRGKVRGDVSLATAVMSFKVMQLGLTVLWAMEGPPWAGTYQAVKNQVRFFTAGLKKTGG